MLHLLERLPQETLFSHPQLFFLGCLTYSLTARHTKAEKWIAQIRESDAVRNPAISSRLALADAAVAMQHDETQRAIDLLEPLYGTAAENRFLHYVHLTTLAAAYSVGGRYGEAYRLLDDNPVPQEDRRNNMALVFEGVRATTLLVEGRVQEAARLGATLLARSEAAHGRRSICANLCAATLGDACYELDLIDDAREVLANRTGILQFSAPGVMVASLFAVRDWRACRNRRTPLWSSSVCIGRTTAACGWTGLWPTCWQRKSRSSSPRGSAERRRSWRRH
jgi:LuxR family maltose regulon positive regulatory protein